MEGLTKIPGKLFHFRKQRIGIYMNFVYRYPKVIAFSIKHFLDYNLDAVFVTTNAPGRSAFNMIERKMAPLSAQLAGIILPFETYGTHLDGHGKTIDSDLELKNFGAAGEALANVWSGLIIDGHEVAAEFKPPGNQPALPQLPESLWYSVHVRESQYTLQVVKCRNFSCCKAMRSNLLNILPERFLPPPSPIRQTTVGLLVPEMLRAMINFYHYSNVFRCKFPFLSRET